MLSTHIILVVLLSIAFIIFAEYQKMRLITWILIIFCAVYVGSILLSNYEPQSDQLIVKNTISSIFTNSDSTIEQLKDDLIKTSEMDDSIQVIIDPVEKINLNSLEIPLISITQNIVDRMPTDISTLFINDINSIYCYTGVKNLEVYNKIIHIWKYNGQDYKRSNIRVGESPFWRCWSKIAVNPSMVGEWEVVVTDTMGKYLNSKGFSIIADIEL